LRVGLCLSFRANIGIIVTYHLSRRTCVWSILVVNCLERLPQGLARAENVGQRSNLDLTLILISGSCRGHSTLGMSCAGFTEERNYPC
jgi:hypothetical protein